MTQQRGMSRRTSSAISDDPIVTMRQEMGRLFGNFFGMSPMSLMGAPDSWIHADVYEDDKRFRISADLPGLKPEDVRIELQGDTLLIRGERKQDEERDEGGWHRVERSYGTFTRTFTLPLEIDRDAIRADFDRGVLEIELPKSPRAQETQRRIPINSSGGQAQMAGGQPQAGQSAQPPAKEGAQQQRPSDGQRSRPS